jgi:hypothetical protein
MFRGKQPSMINGREVVNHRNISLGPFLHYNWTSTNFTKSMSTLFEFFTVILVKGQNKLECLSSSSLFILVYYL